MEPLAITRSFLRAMYFWVPAGHDAGLGVGGTVYGGTPPSDVSCVHEGFSALARRFAGRGTVDGGRCQDAEEARSARMKNRIEYV